jgi:hypothetical protein
MKYRIVTSVLVLMVPVILTAQGTYEFLRNDLSARAAGLNGSFVSMTDDPNVLFYNPGALPTLSKPAGSLSFLKHLLDVNAGSIAYARAVEGIGTVGGGIIFFDYGTFTETDASMNTVGEFSARDLALVAGIGTELDENVLVGVNVKGIYSSIADYRSAAVAFDVGLLYYIPEELISIGVSVLNVGRQLNAYGEVRESLPLDVKIGITKRPEHLPAYLNLDFHKLNESQSNILQRFSSFTLGAEFLMSESVRLRVGYSNEKRKELKIGTGPGLAGFSIGGGIVFQDYLIDYAFNSYGKIGGLHRISVTSGF